VAEHDQKQPEEEAGTAAGQPETEELVEASQPGPGQEEGAADDAAEAAPEEVIAQLEAALAEARDTAMRAQAEAQNVKRRAEQDVEKARKFALEQFARELLPVVDNLERALEATSGGGEAVKAIAEGVDLTLKSFQDALQKSHIEVIDPQGEPFDPNLHQAMSMVENAEVEPNSVIAVMMKGYTLNGRLLRPAMVMVSKAAS